jgi:hypothetical protein
MANPCAYREHTEKTNGSNDLSGVNAQTKEDGVDGGVERGGEGATAQKRINTVAGVLPLLGVGGVDSLSSLVNLSSELLGKGVLGRRKGRGNSRAGNGED